jgi:hypothetical protein
MRRATGVLAVLMIIGVLASCAGPKGDMGDQGPVGPEGPEQPGIYYVRMFQQGVYSSAYTGQVQAVLKANIPSTYYNNQNDPIEVGKQAVPSLYRSIIKFNLSSLPSSKIIVDKAEMYLWTNAVVEGSGALNVGVYRQNAAWAVNEAGFGISAIGSDWPDGYIGGFESGNNTVTVNGGYFNFPADSKVTIGLKPELVQDWMMNPDTNYGVILKSQDEEITNYSQIYSSGATDTSKRPMLKIWYYTTE